MSHSKLKVLISLCVILYAWEKNCILTAIIHIIVLAAIVKNSKPKQPDAFWNVFSIGFLYLGK